ncbi:YbaN family protein [Vibrio sonorensis]|uniref:YbaN family protein n=1 Tax=Vibrio sonorensis TaxID=1004316 RepID=UPI000AE6A2EC|nr:YbaN family protein [Vibrio sonorensis]
MLNRSLTRWLLMVCGWAAIVLGVAGVVLPLLPTTPFILLAAACFYRSSPRIHRKMTTHSKLGPIIREWQEDRTVKKEVKIKAALLMLVSLSISGLLLTLA